MIGKFTEWINENTDILDEAKMEGIGTFGAGGHNGGFGYYKQVIESLLNDEPVYLVELKESLVPTNDVSENYITKKDFKKINTLESFLKFAPDAAKLNYDLFNNCWKHTINDGEHTDRYKDPIWKYIYKGQFTGGRGANKGNAFEKEFAENFNSFMKGGKPDEMYVKAFNQILRYAGKSKQSKIKDIVMEGKKNKKRSIMINNNDVMFTSRNELTLKGKSEDKLNIGPTVTDVTINWKQGDPTYLSLKHGDTIEQVNIGISWARDDIDAKFNEVLKSGELPKKWTLNSDSKTAKFCKFLGIDINKLMWSMWLKDTNKKENPKFAIQLPLTKTAPDTLAQDIKSQQYTIEQGSPLYKFILDCIGYGYIYIHYENNKLNIIDLTKPESIDRIFNTPIKAQVLYSNGQSKTYVKIHIKDARDANFFDGLFEIRPNNGKLAFNVCNLKFNYNHENLEDVVKKK